MDICFLDWQFLRYCSPVVDLSFFFCTSAEQNLLDDHFDDLIDEYIGHLHERIKILGSNPDKVYPQEEFRIDLKRYYSYGVIASTHVLKFLLAKKDEMSDMVKLSLSNDRSILEKQFEFKHSDSKMKYVKRIRDVVRHASIRNFI